MKNSDYIINKDYELLVMDSDFIREKIMTDCNLSDADIEKYFISADKKFISPKILSHNEEHALFRVDYYINNYQDILDILLKKDLIVDGNKIKIDKLLEAIPNKEEITDNNRYFRDKYIYTYTPVTLKEYVDNISKIKLENFNSEKIKESNYLNRAIESSFIVLNKTIDGKYQLIDGFYRLLFKQLSKKVIVKVYSDLNNYEWMQLMITYNAWKIDNNNKLKFFDRGFILGLKSRFDINLDTYISYRPDKNIIKELHYYVNNLESRNLSDLFNGKNKKKNADTYKEAQTLLSNLKSNIDYNSMLSLKYFIDDFKILGEIFNYIPNDLPDVIENNFRKEFKIGYNCFINNVITTICCIRVIYKDKKQSKLDLTIIDELLKNREIKTSLKKSFEMSVEGNIKNRADTLFPTCFEIIKAKLVLE